MAKPSCTSHIEPRTSNVERRTSNVERRTSNVERRTSNVERRTEKTMTADDYIGLYRLQRHPEGGWYREVHRSAISIGLLAGYYGERTALTAIYFLLAAGDFSAF